MTFITNTSYAAIIVLGMKNRLYINQSGKELFQDVDFWEIIDQAEYYEQENEEKNQQKFYQDFINYMSSDNYENSIKFNTINVNKFWQSAGQKNTDSESLILDIQALNQFWDNQKVVILNIINETEICKFEQLKQEQVYKNWFLRSLNHEVRHPIAAIQNGIESTINHFKQIENNDQQNNLQLANYIEKLETIEQQSKSLLYLTISLTDINEIQSGNFKIIYKKFRTSDFAKQAFDLIRFQANRKKLNLILKINQNIPEHLICDKQKLIQTIQYMLFNAVKYTKNGSITISISKENIEDVQDFNTYKVSIKDTGQGMDQNKIDSLFKLFHETNMKKGNNIIEGSGLGLFISNQLARQLGDHNIQVKSQLNEFSKFSFYFKSMNINKYEQQKIEVQKLNRQQQSAEIYLENQLSIDFCKLQKKFTETKTQKDVDNLIKQQMIKIQQCECSNILLVDDTEFIRFILFEIFTEMGYKVQEAEDGQQAIEIVQQRIQCTCCNKFLIIIMDCQMPVLDGWNSTRKIRQMGYFGPIIGHTAYTTQEDVNRCLKVGMNHVLPKPTKKAQIIKVFEKFALQKRS